VFHIGVDIGGTFTDCVLVGEGTDEAVTYGTAKTLSTRADPAEGVLAGLAELAASLGIPLLGDEGPWSIDVNVDGADEVSEQALYRCRALRSTSAGALRA